MSQDQLSVHTGPLNFILLWYKWSKLLWHLHEHGRLVLFLFSLYNCILPLTVQLYNGLNWWKGKPSESTSCTGEKGSIDSIEAVHQCDSGKMKDATPLTPPSGMSGTLFLNVNNIQSKIPEDQKNIYTQWMSTLECCLMRVAFCNVQLFFSIKWFLYFHLVTIYDISCFPRNYKSQ